MRSEKPTYYPESLRIALKMLKIQQMLRPKTMIFTRQLVRPPSDSLLTGMAEWQVSDVVRDDRSRH
jgi:hypothetical protein